MAILDQVFGGGVGQLVKDVVGTFKLSPEAKAEFDSKIAENDFLLKQMDANLESKLSDNASANIQAEEKSGDKYTARARPTFAYIIEFILFWNYVVVPLIPGKVPIALPDSLFWLFGSYMLGYVGARSWEKISGMAGK